MASACSGFQGPFTAVEGKSCFFGRRLSTFFVCGFVIPGITEKLLFVTGMKLLFNTQ